MAKIYVQSSASVWQSAASMAASGCQTSGSFWTRGYSRIAGVLNSSASLKAGSGLRVSQSGDSGSNFDYNSDWAPSACSGSAFSIEVVGDMAKIEVRTDSQADVFRTSWWLRPV